MTPCKELIAETVPPPIVPIISPDPEDKQTVK